jgi:hypothetical protein
VEVGSITEHCSFFQSEGLFESSVLNLLVSYFGVGLCLWSKRFAWSKNLEALMYNRRLYYNPALWCLCTF